MRTQPLLVGLGVLLGILLGVPFSAWLMTTLNLSDPSFSFSTALSSPVFLIKAIGMLALLSGLLVGVSLHSWKILLLANISTILITAAAEWIYAINGMTISIVLAELIAFIALGRHLSSLAQDL